MPITLDAITLPEDLIWVNEYKETQVAQNTTRTLSGALIVESSLKLKGRSIILEGEESAGWIDKTTLDALVAKIDLMAVMTLTLNDARTFQVVFDNQSAPITADPIIDYNTPDAADYYWLTLRLMEV